MLLSVRCRREAAANSFDDFRDTIHERLAQDKFLLAPLLPHKCGVPPWATERRIYAAAKNYVVRP